MSKYISFNDLRRKLGGRSRSAIYLDLAQGRLPQPMKLGGNNYWCEAELEAHLLSLKKGEQR